MAKASGLVAFLVDNPVGAEVEVELAGRLKGNTIKLRPMTSREYADWQKAGTRTRTVKNAKESYFDENWFNMQLIVNCVVEPNFKDNDMLTKAGVEAPEEFIKRFFLPGEILHIADFITQISGFGTDNALEEKAKNS